MVPVTTNQSSKMCFCSLSVLSVLSVLLWLSGSGYQSPPAIKHDGKSIWKPSFIYIFRMIFLSENLHKPSLFRSFSHAFPSLFLWFSLWFFRWIRWGSSRASAEPFGLQHAVLSHRQRLDAIRLHLDGIEKSQAVSGNPWDVSVSHGSLEKAANNQKLRYHGYIIWDICIG